MSPFLHTAYGIGALVRVLDVCRSEHDANKVHHESQIEMAVDHVKYGA